MFLIKLPPIISYYHLLPSFYLSSSHTREHELMKIHKSHLKIKRIKSLTFLNANNPGHAFILVYSVTSRQSLEELKPMWEMIRSIKGDLTDIPVILVGNKCDETDNREVVQVCFVFFFYPYHTSAFIFTLSPSAICEKLQRTTKHHESTIIKTFYYALPFFSRSN